MCATCTIIREPRPMRYYGTMVKHAIHNRAPPSSRIAVRARLASAAGGGGPGGGLLGCERGRVEEGDGAHLDRPPRRRVRRRGRVSEGGVEDEAGAVHLLVVHLDTG